LGYPMTWQRVVNRNRLAVGDYDNAGDHAARVNLHNKGGLYDDDTFYSQVGPFYVERIKGYESQMKSILGDLRRLEKDTVDEGEIAKHIASRTDIDVDTVAAVLKEFIAL
jgi:hypothetical protein